MMRNPQHPGGVLKRVCLEPFRISVEEAAEGLGVSRETLEDLVAERNGVTPDMAVRLAKAFGSTPETWLRMQHARDLADVRRCARGIKVRDFRADAAA